jgi:hypothetical protein
MISRIRYIAGYQVAPVSAITHLAEVSDIQPWEKSNKYVVNFKGLDASNLQIARDVRDTYVNREHLAASTLVVVKQLFGPDLLLEVDAIAVTKD